MDSMFSLSPNDLLPRLATPDCPRIIDVCLPEDHALNPRIIPSAQRLSYLDATSLDGPETAPVVVVCQKGFKLSQGVAATLRSRGLDACFLAGGMVAWADDSLPLWPVAVHASLGKHGADWVLPEDMTGADLFAAWCVLRCIDPAARWLFVERDQVALVCEKFGVASAQEAAQALLVSQDGLSGHLRDLQDRMQVPSFASVLQGACKIMPRAPMGVAQVSVLFDSLWAAGEGAAQ